MHHETENIIHHHFNPCHGRAGYFAAQEVKPVVSSHKVYVLIPIPLRGISLRKRL